MFDPKHYVPVLQAKRGEFSALRDLPATILSKLTPLLEVPPVAWDWSNNEPAKTLDAHLPPVAVNIGKAWGGTRPIFVDLPNVEPEDRLTTGEHPVKEIFKVLRSEGVLAVPVTGPDRDDDYQAVIKQTIEQDGRGVCVRVGPDSMDGLTVDLSTLILALSESLSVTPSSCDLVIDVGTLAGQVGAWALMVRTILTQPSFVAADWRTITVAAGAFPTSLAGLGVGVSALPRVDWSLWLQICGGLPVGHQRPRFGDYGIQAPGLPDVDPRFMKLSANVRYTSTSDWIVLRGGMLTGKNAPGHSEYKKLCQTLVGRGEFRGGNFSPGDQYVTQCAAGQVPTGNPETWRRQGTSHHLATVVDALDNLVVP